MVTYNRLLSQIFLTVFLFIDIHFHLPCDDFVYKSNLCQESNSTGQSSHIHTLIT